MRLVVGLMNPGERYRDTRHNIGAQLVRRFATTNSISLSRRRFSSQVGEGEIEGEKVLFLLPETFMNRSGEAVGEAMRFYKIQPAEMLVAHDDIDLPLGRLKFDFDAGPAGHNGVLSIIEGIGEKAFFRLRLGIGRPARKEEVEGFVLSPFLKSEQEKVGEMLEAGEKRLKKWVKEEKGCSQVTKRSIF